MGILLLVSLMILGIGLYLVRVCLPSSLKQWPDWLLCLSLAFGMGSGIASLLFFIGLNLGISSGMRDMGLLIGFSMGLILTGTLKKSRLKSFPKDTVGLEPVNTPKPSSKIERWIAPVFILLLAFAFFRFITLSIYHPYGQWGDAWAIWNLHARFLALGGNHWTELFSSQLAWSHPDYPLLLPGLIALLWRCHHSVTPVVPIIVAFGFTFSTIGLLTASIAKTHGKTLGLLAGVMLLGTPFLIQLGANQYADVPLAYYMLATLVLLGHHFQHDGKHPGALSLAGMAAGFAAWTKNEGLLFLMVFLLAFIASMILLKGFKALLSTLLPVLKGLLPAILVVFYFKGHFAPANDLVAGQSHGATLTRLLSPGRYILILKYYLLRSLDFTRGLINPYVLGLFLWLQCPFGSYSTSITALIAIVVMTLMLGGYFLIYLTTPNDLQWHLGSSLNRLLLQLWPIFIWTCFQLIKLEGQEQECEVK